MQQDKQARSSLYVTGTAACSSMHASINLLKKLHLTKLLGAKNSYLPGRKDAGGWQAYYAQINCSCQRLHGS